MIDRYVLRYFLAVIDHGTFSRAALHCRVSQPTLSVGIAKLERALDHPLFLRSSRRVELTAAGTRFAVHARRIEAEFTKAERAVTIDAPKRLIRIGIVPTLPSLWVGHALCQAHDPGSKEHFELFEGRMRELIPLLDRGRLDAILGPVLPSEIDPLFTEDYALALSDDHHHAGRLSLTPEEVAGDTMIVRRQCEALGEISRFFTSHGVRPFMAARTNNDERAVAYVRAGLGVTVMPRCFQQPGLKMPALSGFTVTRAIGLRIAPDSVGRLAASSALSRFCDAFRALQLEPGIMPR